MARHYSQMERSPSPPPSPPYVYTRTTPLPHTAVMHRRQTDLQEETFLSSHSTNLSERSHPNQNTRIYLAFLFLSFVPEFYRFLFFCWCVHIAYISIWCPVDIVVFLNLDFTDLCGFYINMRGGVKAVHWEIHSSTSWHSLGLKNSDEVVLSTLFLSNRFVPFLPFFKRKYKAVNQRVNSPLLLQLLSSEMVFRCSQFIRLIQSSKEFQTSRLKDNLRSC